MGNGDLTVGTPPMSLEVGNNEEPSGCSALPPPLPVPELSRRSHLLQAAGEEMGRTSSATDRTRSKTTSSSTMVSAHSRHCRDRSTLSEST